MTSGLGEPKFAEKNRKPVMILYKIQPA